MSSLSQVLRSIGGALCTPAPTPDNPAERRVSPRVSKRLPVEVEGRSLTTTNVSQSGLQVQVSCPQSWLRSLQETWNRDATEVRIELPEGDLMEVECSVAYVSECDDEYLIGLKFNNPKDAHREPWQSYLAQLYGDANLTGAANAA